MWFPVLFLLGTIVGQPSGCQEFDGFTCDGWVTDVVNALEDEAEAEARTAQLVADFGHQVAIVFVDSTNGDVKTYAEDLGNTWGVGDDDRDDGIVVVVAVADRSIWIATGPGLQVADNELDAIADLGGAYFGSNDYDRGVAAILFGLDATFAAEAAGLAPPFGSVGPVVDRPEPEQATGGQDESALPIGAAGFLGGAGLGLAIHLSERRRWRKSAAG